jgi:hypothetical protein
MSTQHSEVGRAIATVLGAAAAPSTSVARAAPRAPAAAPRAVRTDRDAVREAYEFLNPAARALPLAS